MNLTKKNMGFAAALAGVLALAGCQRGEQEQQRQATPMKSAERSAEQAANQQEKAAEKAGEAAEARQDVREERQETAEARREAQEKTAEAQQAQQRAEQLAAEAGQQMDRAGQQAMGGQAGQPGEQAGQPGQTGQPGQMAQAGTGTEQTASGELVRASDEEIVLRPEGGQQGELTLKVSESTPVTIDGREGKISDLKEGTQIRASYEDAQGERTATRIEAQQQ